jgi:hypothetical protein
MNQPENRTIPGVNGAIEGLDVEVLREAIRAEYTQVASDPSGQA